MRVAALRALVILCVLQISGAHWAVLQTAAWAGMLVARTAATADVKTAVETTFNGAHPCGVCIAVSKGREQEEQNKDTAHLISQLAKADFLLPSPIQLSAPTSVDFEFALAVFRGASQSLAPPTLPPKSLA